MKRQLSFLLCLVLMLQTLLVGCSKDTNESGVNDVSNEPKESVAEVELYSDYEKPIGEPISIEIAENSGEIGDLESQFVKVNIPEGTFESSVKVFVKTPDAVQNVKPDDSLALGAPIQVDIDRESKRFDQEVLITMKLTPENIEGIIHGDEIMIAYHNGIEWDYIRPYEVNLEEGYVIFGTYHFSPFWATKPTKEKRIEDYIDKKSTADWAAKQGFKGSDEVLEKMVSEMVKAKFGNVNKSLVQDVVEGIMKQDDYTKLMVSYNDYRNLGDKDPKILEGIAMDQSVLVGKQLFQVIDTVGDYADLKGSLLQELAGKANWLSTGAKMTDAAFKGKYEEAAKHLSNELIGLFPVTKFLQTGADVIDRQIKRWKSEEMEAAYKVFSNGAESKIPFWGYQVKAGNFEQVWDQMRGLREKIYSDAIADYYRINEIPIDAWGQPTVELSAKKLDQIRKEARDQIEKDFTERREREDEIEDIKETNAELIQAFKDSKLLEWNRYGYNRENMSLEQRMAELFRIRDRIERDTGKPIGIKRGSLGEYIPVNDVAYLAQTLKRENGEKEYEKLLIKLGYKEKPPVDLSGNWSGSLKIISAPPNGEMEMCGEMVEMDWQEIIGQTATITMAITGSEGNYKGTVIVNPSEDDPMPFDVSFNMQSKTQYVLTGNDGELTAEFHYSEEPNEMLAGSGRWAFFGFEASLTKSQ